MRILRAAEAAVRMRKRHKEELTKDVVDKLQAESPGRFQRLAEYSNNVEKLRPA